MEQITKQQVILIALLVAIITAISTSVATVSLLDNPSGGSGQTIYKVIEKSFETVANIPAVKDISTSVKSSPSTTQLSPSDIASAGAKGLIRIYDISNGDRKFVALAVAVGNKGGALASTPEIQLSSTSQYLAVTADGHEIRSTLTKADLPGGLAFFTMNYDAAEKNKVQPLEIKDLSSLKLGSNAVALGGKESGNVVSTGIVTEFSALDGKAATSTDMVSTDMNLSSNISGWLLFDTSGNLVGFETAIGEAKVARFLNGSILKASLSGLL